MMNGTSESKIRILIAEDEDDLREMYVVSFSGSGFEVVAAKNGKEAMDLIAKNFENLDAILSDLVMPMADGMEVLEFLLADEKYKKIRIFVSTNLDNIEDRQQAFELGASDYFVKSRYAPNQLAEIIRFSIKTRNEKWKNF